MLNTLSSNVAAALEALNNAKVHLMTKQGSRFLSSVSVMLDHVISDEVPTAATDGKQVLYNPDFFLKQSKEKRVGLIAHEVWHVGFMHMFRVGDKDKKIWNMAGDYVINGMLISNGFQIPDDGLHDIKFDGWSTEQVYEYLIKEAIDPPPDYVGDLIPKEDGDSSEEAEQASTNIVIRAIHRTKMEGGKVPQEIAIAIETLINPKLHWTELLYRFVDEKTKEDYSWARPNKKYLPDFYLPSRYSESLKNVTVFIDTSGSMLKPMLIQILTEIQYINDTIKPSELTVVDCDSAIHNIYHVTSNDSILDFKFTGGGGTSAIPILRYINDNPTNLAIYFTDGEMSLNLPEPSCPFLWVISKNKQFIAPFGESIYVDD